MTMFLINLALSATIISIVTWVSNKNPSLGGFLVALPISTMLVLGFSHAEYQDPVASIKLAKSIFAAIPLSLLFFVPFLFAERLGWSFWVQYGVGTGLLGAGYLIHRVVAPML